MQFRERYHYNPKQDFIGRGGFAKVYKGFDTIRECAVALKFYKSEGSDKYSLLGEIKRVINFEHPNICKYHDVALLEGTNHLGEEERTEVGIMEYLDGGNIKDYIEAHPQHLKRLLFDVLQGLSYLHQHNIIHRDLKPANILIKPTASGPVAKITDFGISKKVGSSTTKSSELLGTIEYMAPEQFNPSKYGIGGKISYNLDLWSFGCLVYELISGESFFGSRGELGTEQVMMKILEEVDQTKVDSLPQPFRAVVKECLVKHANERVQRAEELISIIKGKTSARQTGSTEVEVIRTNSRVMPVVADEATKVIEKEALSLPKPGAGAGISGREIAIAAEQKRIVVQKAEKKNKQQLLFGGITAIVVLAGVYIFGNGESEEASLAEATVVATDTLASEEEVLPEVIAPDIEAELAEEEKKKQEEAKAAEEEKKKQEEVKAAEAKAAEEKKKQQEADRQVELERQQEADRKAYLPFIGNWVISSSPGEDLVELEGTLTITPANDNSYINISGEFYYKKDWEIIDEGYDLYEGVFSCYECTMDSFSWQGFPIEGTLKKTTYNSYGEKERVKVSPLKFLSFRTDFRTAGIDRVRFIK